MKELIEEVSFELWKSISKLDQTFEWKLNWFYYKKVEILWKILDELLDLEQKEKLLLNK